MQTLAASFSVSPHPNLGYNQWKPSPLQSTRTDTNGLYRTLSRTRRNFTSSQSHPKQRLDSWKEIAAFFERDERTVRRWEIERGLPIHRMPGARGVVYAFTNELEEWLRRPQSLPIEGIEPDPKQPAPIPVAVTDLAADGTSPGGSSPRRREALSDAPPPKIEDIRSHIHLLPWVVAGALAVAVFAGVYSYRQTARFRARAANAEQPNAHTRGLSSGADSVAVLPFANGRGDANTDYISDGITESLIYNLAHIPEIKVRSRNSVFRYKGKDVDVQKVGNDLGVAALVSGRVTLRGDRIEVSAELTDARDNSVIWGQHYSGKSIDLLSLQQQIAGDIADKLRSKLSASEKQQVTRQGTQNPEAFDLYLKGRYAWNKRTMRDVEQSISYFNQAIAKDPGYALADSGLADAYSVMPNFSGAASENFPKSNAAARKALELDPTLAHPHAVLGVNETQYDWDFAGGEAEFKKALELDPNDATAHQWYAESIERIGGREQEALAEINRAHRLDPQSPVITRVLGGILVTARQYDQGIAVCQKLANDNPTFAIAHDCLAYAYWAKRMYAKVIEEWKTYAQLTGNPEDAEYLDAMDQGFRAAGWKGALTKAIEYRQVQVNRGHASPVQVAYLYADLGDKDEAFRWLNIAYQEHDWLLIGLNTYFQLDPLRSDPRFDELVRKVGLPQ